MTPTGAQRAIDRRRADVARGEQILVAPTTAVGLVEVQNAGEVLVEVTFPVWFTERPFFSFGGELAEGHSPEATNFPTVSAVVNTWTKNQRGLGTYWVGATLCLVTTGRADHRMVVHWRMEGKALANPVSPNTSMETGI